MRGGDVELPEARQGEGTRSEDDERRRSQMELARARATGHVGDTFGGIALTEAQRRTARIDVAEEMIVEECGDRYRAAARCMQAWSMGRRNATRYVTAAIDRWRIEAAGMSREERRAVMRARLRELARASMRHRRPLVVGDGMGVAHVELHHDAQERSALSALELESKLDGLLEQPDQQSVTVNVRTEVLTELERHYGAKAALVVDEEPEVKALEPDAADG